MLSPLARFVLVIALLLGSYGPARSQTLQLRHVRDILANTPDREDYIRHNGVVDGTAPTCDIGPWAVPEWKFGPAIAAQMVLVSRGMTYRAILTYLHYPPAVISEAIGQYESHGIGLIRRDPAKVFDGTSEDVINAYVNAYRARANSRLAKIEFGNRECGGTSGLPRAIFIIRPASTRAFLIPDFFAKLCRARSIDSFDMNRCSGWIEMLDGSQLSVYGRYVYQLRSSSGQQRRGNLKLEATGPVRLSL